MRGWPGWSLDEADFELDRRRESGEPVLGSRTMDYRAEKALRHVEREMLTDFDWLRGERRLARERPERRAFHEGQARVASALLFAHIEVRRILTGRAVR